MKKENEVNALSNRILVKVTASESEIGLQTVTEKRKSPHRFLIQRNNLDCLWRDGNIILYDLHSFALIHDDRARNIVTIRFFWLTTSGGDTLTGWQQIVRLPRDKFTAFLAGSKGKEGAKQWKVLSLEERRQPKLVFCARDNLHAAISNKVVRGKLVRFLRDHFNWPSADEIRFFNDFLPYSFFFQEFRSGRPGICGGLILQDHQDLSKAYYSMHT